MFEYIHHVAYIVSDMDDAVSLFGDTFEMELIDRRVIEGENSFEMATFNCGSSQIELLRPINHQPLAQFLRDHGPGLHHVAFAMKDLPKRKEDLRRKGVVISEPFVAPTGWKIAYFDLNNSDLALFQSQYHGDHVAEAEIE
jgi:catechol 2,3-dioxygenase-like lactoylglutathione lyase family enzyme